MSENIEQLWYTWSATGLTGYTAGYRVRAASPGLLNNIQSEYFNTVVLGNLDYALPQGTRQLHTVALNEAPICLSLIDTGNERLLVHKQYIGKDGEGRPGNYFVHFLSSLPRSYSARDAIDLWADPSVWATSEQALGPKDKQLPYMAYSQLLAHQATCGQTLERPVWLDLEGIRTYLPLLIHEYVLPYLTQGHIQRFYLGSSSSTRIASLLWGLTHSLPPGWLRTLTFSTYESDVRTSNGVVVGICWIPSQGKNNLTGIPDSCQSEFTRAFNCDTPPPPLASLNEVLIRYARFVTQCVVTSNLRGLYKFLEKAEKKQQTDKLEHFLDFYRQEIEKEPRTKGQCATILDLQRETDYEELQEDSFWRDVLTWILQDPTWWEPGVKRKVARLLDLTKQATERRNVVKARTLSGGVAALAWQASYTLEEAMRQKTWEQFPLLLDVLATTTPLSTDTTYWPKLFAQLQEQSVLADARWTPLQQVLTVLKAHPAPAPDVPFWPSLVKLFTAYKQTIMQPLVYQDRQGQTRAWIPFSSVLDTLAKVAPPASHAVMWAALLDLLAEDQEALQRQEWKLLRMLLQVLKTPPPPAPDSPFWLALVRLLHRDKAALLERTFVEEKAGQARIGGIPLVRLLETLVETGVSASHDLIWAALLRLLADDPETMQKTGWKPFTSIINVLKPPLTHPAANSPFWTELLHFLTVNKEELRRHQWGPLLNLLDALAAPASPAPSDTLCSGLLPLLDPYAEEIKQQYWPLYERLMSHWGRILALETSESIHALWLSVPPSKLTDFLALPIPLSWYTGAITSYIGAVRTPNPPQERNVVALVTRHERKFTEVLCTLILFPDWDQIVVEFFTLLVRAQYQSTLALLVALLRPRENNAIPPPAVADQLVRAAELIPTQIIQLFGNYWQEIVVPYGWLPAMVILLKEYLTTLEVDDLKHTHTKMVLQNILEPKPVDNNQEEWERVQRLARSWNNLGAFIDRPEQRLKLPVLRRVSEAIETILDQCNDADKLERRTKIASKLTPLLVEVVTTEEELGRVLDHLGPVLGDPRSTKEDEKLTIRLLLSMAKQIGDQVKQSRRLPGGLSKHESLLVRLVPYVKVALPRVRDAYETNRPRAEEVITACFRSLYLDTTIVKFLNTAAASWPEKTRQGWEDYVRRHPPPREPDDQNLAVTSGATYSTPNGPGPLLLLGQGSMRAESQAQSFSTQAKQYALLPGPVQTPAPVRDSFSTWIRPSHLWTIGVGAAVGLVVGMVLGALFLKLMGILIVALIGLVFGALLVLFIDKLVAFLKERKHAAGKTGEGTPAGAVANVNGKAIWQEFFQKAYRLKYRYAANRYDYLASQVQGLEQEQPTPERIAMIKFRRAEMQTLHTQLNILKIPDMLEQTVLEELVDDVLIQQGITEAANKRELDPLDLEQRVRVDVGRFQSYEGANYPILLSQNRLTEQDVVDVLQVFARRNQFAWYLFERNPPSSLEAWLEQRKKNKKTKIERHLPVPQNAAGAGWPGIRQ